jgi:amino acid transporter
VGEYLTPKSGSDYQTVVVVVVVIIIIIIIIIIAAAATTTTTTTTTTTFKKALIFLRGHLAYPNGLLDLHIETIGRTPWPGDQPDARPLPAQDNTT